MCDEVVSSKAVVRQKYEEGMFALNRFRVLFALCGATIEKRSYLPRRDSAAEARIGA